jgi:hypothetical protein
MNTKTIITTLLIVYSCINHVGVNAQIKTTRLINDEIGGGKKVSYNIVEEDGFKKYFVNFLFQNQEYSSITDFKSVSCVTKECLEKFLKDLKAANLSIKERTNLSWRNEGYKYTINKYDFTSEIYISENDGTRNYTKLNSEELERLILKLSDIDFGSERTLSGNAYEKNSLSKTELYKLAYDEFKRENYLKSDSLFSIYKVNYPDEVYGHYWSFRAKSLIDSTMEKGLALEDCKNFIKVAETDVVKNKSTLVTAYGYLAGYTANIEKDLKKALNYFYKILEIDPYNADAKNYASIIEKAINSGIR